MGTISSLRMKSASAFVSVPCPSARAPERKGKAIRIMKRRRCFDMGKDVFIPLSYNIAAALVSILALVLFKSKKKD